MADCERRLQMVKHCYYDIQQFCIRTPSIQVGLMFSYWFLVTWVSSQTHSRTLHLHISILL